MTIEVIQWYYNLPTQGYQGIEKTTEIILRIFYFSYMWKKVEEYI